MNIFHIVVMWVCRKDPFVHFFDLFVGGVRNDIFGLDSIVGQYFSSKYLHEQYPPLCSSEEHYYIKPELDFNLLEYSGGLQEMVVNKHSPLPDCC